MRPSTLDDNNSSSDGSSNSDMFSPIQGRRLSLRDSSFSTVVEPHADDSLPALQDKSWIGARVSPIQSFDNDDDDGDADDLEDFRATAPYRKALNESLDASFLVATERSRLLGGGNKRRARGFVFGSAGGGLSDQQVHIPLSSIHPLWEDKKALSAPKRDKREIQPFATVDDRWWSFVCATRYWGTVVIATSTGILACMGLHDGYLWYLSKRRGIELPYSLAWTLPWLTPTARTLIQFGAFSPERLVERNEYWRIVSSPYVSTSVGEWVLLLWAWAVLRHSSGTLLVVGSGLPNTALSSPPPARRGGSVGLFMIWAIVYNLSAWTGQLWVTAFPNKNGGVSGCASWGTCGILCAAGISQPNRRFLLFMTAIALVSLDTVQSLGSTFGALGGSFFGWAFFGVGLTPVCPVMQTEDSMKEQRRGCLHVVSAFVVLKLWVIPTYFIIRNKSLS
jgi:hypothetical protein